MEAIDFFERLQEENTLLEERVKKLAAERKQKQS